MRYKKIIILCSLLLIFLILSGCRIKVDDVTIRCNEITGECTATGLDNENSDINGSNSTGTEPGSSGNYTNDVNFPDIGLNSDVDAMVAYARSFKGKDTGLDCSHFMRKVLREYGYYDESIKTGRCDNDSGLAHGMYLYYKDNDRLVWERDLNVKSRKDATLTFPGNCESGDLIFYTYGSTDSKCVKHVAMYIGYENGEYRIVDSNINNHIAAERKLHFYHNAVPFACARPIKNE